MLRALSLFSLRLYYTYAFTEVPAFLVLADKLYPADVNLGVGEGTKYKTRKRE